ncbi:MAG: FliM/FliN family flagellar motor switch protein [Rudaea sp.]|uniref:FliM/FliN family flagellar motor switch protein n=1 Tax=unclassified Rudaea TaxID=2627037 RepID=UPI0010F7CE3E|nr:MULTISPECIES: FliM/FliN family flagellar motor switch protein [unclassified Rudaea]MBN8887443.1 FliM/FliN family flagellar motor switch protein [Rudaea sp.]
MTAHASQTHPSPHDAAAARTPQSLRGRLPKLDGARAQLARKLFDAARVFTAKNGVRLSVAAPGPLPRELVECEAGSERVLLAFARDEILDPCAGGAWNDYQGFGRCVAWTLAHERLLHALSDLLGQSLLPRKLLVAGNPTAGVVWLGLRATVQDAESIGVVALSSGLAHALAETLRTRAAQSAATARPDAGLLRERLLLTAPGPRLRRSDIADLVAGDVIVLGTKTGVLADLRLRRTSHRLTQWPATWRDGRVHVNGPATTGNARSYPVNDTASDIHNTAATAANAQAQIPVALEFELGAVDSSLRDLARIEPGYVFDLPLTLDHAAVTIRSAGKRIGRGELVAVGDTLGVRLTEWIADGG